MQHDGSHPYWWCAAVVDVIAYQMKIRNEVMTLHLSRMAARVRHDELRAIQSFITEQSAE